MARVVRPYVPVTKHTPEQLREALIADLDSDLAFSLRSDPPTPEWVVYQTTIRADLERLRAGEADARL